MKLDLKKLVKENKKLKSNKQVKEVKGYLTKKIGTKDIIKKNKMTLEVSNKEVENVFDDENRFFKGQYEKEKRSLFFS